jgi:hypothetical protein
VRNLVDAVDALGRGSAAVVAHARIVIAASLQDD